MIGNTGGVELENREGHEFFLFRASILDRING